MVLEAEPLSLASQLFSSNSEALFADAMINQLFGSLKAPPVRGFRLFFFRKIFFRFRHFLTDVQKRILAVVLVVALAHAQLDKM